MPNTKVIAATNKKDKGNEAFLRSDFKTALACYNESLCVHPLPATYNNRAMTYINLEMYDKAIEDCHEVIKMEPLNAKAYYRRSLCYKSLGDLRSASEDIKISLELLPGNGEIKQLRDSIDSVLAVNKEITPCLINLQVSETKPNICNHKVRAPQVTCITNSTKHFDYIEKEDDDDDDDDNDDDEDDKETPVMGTIEKEDDDDDDDDDDDEDRCARCKTYICVLWNVESKKKNCIPPSYSIIHMVKSALLDLFPDGQTYHDYGFCNMEFFYSDDYYESSPHRDPSFRNPSHVLLGLYKMIIMQISFKNEGMCSQVLSSHSFPLSIKALHQACMENSLDAYIQQYINDLISRGLQKHISGTYPDMWKKRKYIIGPTRLGVNDTAKEVGDMRNELYKYFHAKSYS